MTAKRSLRRSLFTSTAAANVLIVERRVMSRKFIIHSDLGATTCVFIAAMWVEISC